MMEQAKNNCLPQTAFSEHEENIAEYSALRDSIIQCESSIKNDTIYMYVIYFALIVLGFEHSWMLLVSFVVLIIFQTHINEDRIAIEKLSAFIRVFFENRREDIHWETLNKDLNRMKFYNKHIRNLGWYINKAGSSFLALVSFATLAINLFQVDGFQLENFSMIQMVLGLILTAIVIYINSKLYIPDKTAITAHIDKDIEDFRTMQIKRNITLRKVINILSKYTECQKIKANAMLKVDLGISSDNALSIAEELEAEFEIKMSNWEITDLTTARDIVKHLESCV